LLTLTIPLSEKNKCYEIPDFPAKNSGDNNTMNCVVQVEPTVSQEGNLNVAINNEPAKCNLRASRLKNPFDNKDDFLWYEIIIAMRIPITSNMVNVLLVHQIVINPLPY
jgi:hypothetical protein